MALIRVTDDQRERARNCDLLALAERYTTLRRVAASGGGEYGGPCPVPGCTSDDDGFRVQPQQHRWLCRHCTNGKWQDAITLQMRITGQGFVEAVLALADDHLPMASVPTRVATPAARAESGPPPAMWQTRARAVAVSAAQALWRAQGARAREWLHARGLSDETLRRWQVGYIPKDRHEPAQYWGLEGKAVYLPRGIVLPCEVDGGLWYLKIRTSSGQPKYLQPTGSRPALYLAETLRGAEIACVAEGELDTLLLWQCLQEAASARWRGLGVITLGGQSMQLDLAHWARYLYGVKHVLVMLDQDGKSEGGIQYWRDLTDRAHVVRCPRLRPGDKDLTNYHQAGGSVLDLVAASVMQVEAEAVAGDTPQVSESTTPSAPEFPDADSRATGTRWPVTLIWPVDSGVPVVGGSWERLADGRIKATYATREELELALAVTSGRPTDA